mmetsp:Transcript_6836/g.12693  ORF Transcript_6836/g.12693 Transcript_6836/m.12693 type:complete len:338 (+) Transcript_6836:128-1141(+)
MTLGLVRRTACYKRHNFILAMFAQTSLVTRAASSSSCPFPPPDEVVQFAFQQSWDAGNNSKVLRFELPSTLPTLSRPIPSGVSVIYHEQPGAEAIKKSYSPVSSPDAEGFFDLLVKAYPPRPGGGVGAYLCGLSPGDRVSMNVKAPRTIHGSEDVAGRWAHLGFVAGGTGVAPFVQIIRTLLADEGDATQLSLLSVNRRPDDVLMKAEIDALAKESGGRFRVTYALSQPTLDDGAVGGFFRGRGDATLASKALPSSQRLNPTSESVNAGLDEQGDGSSRQSEGTMIMVCGTDGFVDSWAGAITRTKDPVTGKKAKVQGPLKGWLHEAGFRENEVYKF